MTLVYLLFSLLWIYVGDRLLLSVLDTPSQLTHWQTIKGGFFVFISAMLFYVLMQRSLQSLRRGQLHAQQLADMTRHSPAVSICWNNATGWPVSFVSDNIAQWGYKAEEFRCGELTYEDLIHPDDRPRIEAEVGRYFAHGPDSYQQQYRFRHGDGHWIWLEDRTWLVRDKQGHVTDIYGVLVDISEEKKLQEQLRIGEANYRMLFEANPHPMWVYDIDTLSFLTVNDAAIAHYGYSREEFLAMTIRDIRPPEDINRLKDNIAAVTDGLDQAGIWQHITKDGRLLSVEITSHTLTFDGRKAEVVLALDVSDHLKAKKALLDRNTELERYHSLSIGREEQMIALKRQINILSRMLGKTPPYDLSFAEADGEEQSS
jgi:PAS domain S-box-containing protein